MDFVGPINGKMILIVINAHSRWIKAYPTESAASSIVTQLSRTFFAQFGIPETLLSPCFVSEDFKTFLAKNSVKHITSAPYHPATNGLAERAVQTIKCGLKTELQGSLETRLTKKYIPERDWAYSFLLSEKR